MNYFVLVVESDNGAITDSVPKDGPSAWKYHEATPLADEYPKDAFIPFSNAFPKARELVDFQPSLEKLIIVSPKAKQVIEQLGGYKAEFLRLGLKDHKKTVVATDYSILNLIGGEDAIDMERSEYRRSSLDENQIRRITNLVLAPGKIRPDAKIFRCSMYRRLVLIREDVKAAFEAAGLTGWRASPAEGYDEL